MFFDGDWEFPSEFVSLTTCENAEHAQISTRRQPGPTLRQHPPLSGGGRRGKGQLWASRGAHGGRAPGLRALDAAAQAQPPQPPLAQPGPVRPVRRPRLHADLWPAPPDRVRPVSGGSQKFPPMGQPHARPSGARPGPGRGDHHRPPGPGAGQQRGHGPGGTVPRCPLQPPRLFPRGLFRLVFRQRRGHDGGRGGGGRLPGRPPGPGQAEVRVSGQPHHHRRQHLPGFFRGRGPAFRGVRLAGAQGGRRQRSGGGSEGAGNGPRPDGPAHPGHRPHPHRVRQPQQDGHRGRPRRASGAGGNAADQTGFGLAPGAAFLRPGGSPAPFSARGPTGRGSRSPMERPLATVPAGPPGLGRGVGPPAGRPPPRGLAETAARF